MSEKELREALEGLRDDLVQHSDKNIHDNDLMCRSQAAVEGVIADRITALVAAHPVGVPSIPTQGRDNHGDRTDELSKSQKKAMERNAVNDAINEE